MSQEPSDLPALGEQSPGQKSETTAGLSAVLQGRAPAADPCHHLGVHFSSGRSTLFRRCLRQLQRQLWHGEMMQLTACFEARLL